MKAKIIRTEQGHLVFRPKENGTFIVFEGACKVGVFNGNIDDIEDLVWWGHDNGYNFEQVG